MIVVVGCVLVVVGCMLVACWLLLVACRLHGGCVAAVDGGLCFVFLLVVFLLSVDIGEMKSAQQQN